MKLHSNGSKNAKKSKGKPKEQNGYKKQGSNVGESIFGDQSQWPKATQYNAQADIKNRKQKGGKHNLIDEQSIKQAIKASELASKEAEEKAKAKQKELDQIIEMFGGIIDKDIITDYWNGLNCNIEQVITLLSDMVSEIEKQKKQEEDLKLEEEKKIEEEKQRFARDPENGRLKLKPKSKPFIPGKSKAEPKTEEVKEEEKVDSDPVKDAVKETEPTEQNEHESLRTNNPFSNAFNDLEYIEPSEEEAKASQEIADKYLEEQEKEEQEWFIQQEEALLKQLITEYKVEELFGGELDEDTIKAIYNGDNQAEESTTKETNDFFYKDKPFENYDEEVRPFMEDPTLQILIQYQIQTEQAKLAESDYHYNRCEFPSLLGDAQYVLDYLKIYYNEHYNNTHGEVKKINIEPIKSKIPLPPTEGKLRMTPVDNRKYKMPQISSDDNYESVREAEKLYCEKMRYHFNQAARAFRRGDGKMAKIQSKEGAKYKYLYLEEKRRAIDRTLTSKNQRLNINESIDLHGLHANEVEEVMDRYITMLKDKLNTGEIAHNRGSSRGHCVTIITGKGNNSRYYTPVVKNEVERYLRENRIAFKQSNEGGCFTINVV